MSRTSKFVFAIAFLCFAFPGLSQVVQTPKGYLFRLKFQQGKVYTFLAPTEISGISNSPLHLQLKFYVKVLHVAKGHATLKGTMISPFAMGSQKGPKSVILEIDSRGYLQGAPSSISGFTVSYPLEPLNIGSSFTSNVAVGLGQGGASGMSTVPATFKFVGFANYLGTRVAKLDFRCKKKSDPHGFALISVADGIVEEYSNSFLYNSGSGSFLVKAKIIRH